MKDPSFIPTKGKPIDYYRFVFSPFGCEFYLSLDPETTAKMIAGIGEQFAHMCEYHPDKIVPLEAFAA